MWIEGTNIRAARRVIVATNGIDITRQEGPASYKHPKPPNRAASAIPKKKVAERYWMMATVPCVIFCCRGASLKHLHDRTSRLRYKCYEIDWMNHTRTTTYHAHPAQRHQQPKRKTYTHICTPQTTCQDEQNARPRSTSANRSPPRLFPTSEQQKLYGETRSIDVGRINSSLVLKRAPVCVRGMCALQRQITPSKLHPRAK